MTRGVDVVMAWGGSWFHIKLTLVVILIGLFGYMQVLMRKARSADGAPQAPESPSSARSCCSWGWRSSSRLYWHFIEMTR